MNLHFCMLISNRNSTFNWKPWVQYITTLARWQLLQVKSCQGAAVVEAWETRMPAWLSHRQCVPDSLRCQEDAMMGINGRMEVIMRGVELRRIITYTECLKVAITTPKGGSRGYPHIRSLLTDNPLRLVKVGHTIRVYVPHSFWTLVGVLLQSNKNQIRESAVWEDLRFFVLTREKIWESNRLQMSSQRQYVLSSQLFKDVGKSATSALCLLKRSDR